jgi:hypothetical protein
MSTSQWLPRGHHWGLIIEHFPVDDAGALLISAGDKGILHTTEGTFSSAHNIFRTGRDIPHCLIDPATGRVNQYAALDRCVKTLAHPTGTPETNRAGCRQIEIAGDAADSPLWPTHWYNRIAALAVLMEHRTGIPRHCYHAFTATPNRQARRLTPAGFIRSAGWLGHEHVPNQQPTNHWDPGSFRARSFLRGMDAAEKEYQ